MTDREGALETFSAQKDNLSDIINVLVDGGYTGEKFASLVGEIIGVTVEVAKRDELHTFKVIPKMGSRELLHG